MSCPANPAITGVLCTKSIKLLFTEPKGNFSFIAVPKKGVLKLEIAKNSILWQSVYIQVFLRASIFIFNCMQSVFVEKQLCSTHCVFNNSQSIYSLRRRHMHGCFNCFVFVNCLCIHDNDRDHLHLSKYSGK